MNIRNTRKIIGMCLTQRLLAVVVSLIMAIMMLLPQTGFISLARATESEDAVVMQAGHADFGPTYANGVWKLKIRDDSGESPVWRDPENMVFQLTDHAIVPMPSDAAYSFIGEKPGANLYVIPQTQNPDVVWLGWNTQESGVLSNLDRGAQLSLDSVRGPGALHVYLENGNNAPQPLWNSTRAMPQQTWIETNAHTHVNWVFSKPGIYHVRLTFSGKLKNGQTVSDTRTLNFAVGSKTDPAAALGQPDAQSSQHDNQNDADDTQEGQKTDQADQQVASRHHGKQKSSKQDDNMIAGIAQLIIVMVVIMIVVIMVIVLIAVMKSKRARKEVMMRALEDKIRKELAQGMSYPQDPNNQDTTVFPQVSADTDTPRN